MGVKSLSLDSACKQVAQIFHINEKNNSEKLVIRCSRCEGFVEKDRGKGFVVLMSTATSKARENIVVYCHRILPKENISNANLKHTLLIIMSEK